MPKVNYNDPDMDIIEDPKYAMVSCEDNDRCYLYDSEYASGSPVCELQNGDLVEVLSEGPELYRVSTGYGITGYVYRWCLEEQYW